MDETIANSALRTAVTLIEMREPIPLHWAIEYGERIPELWSSVTDPAILFNLFSEMGGLLAPMPMVRALARMLRSSLPPHLGRWCGPTFRALEASEAWTRGEATVEQVYAEDKRAFARREYLRRNLYRVPPSEQFVREKYLFADATCQIDGVVYRTRDEPRDQFRDALKAVLAVAMGSFGTTAAIMREYLPEPTIAMIVDATRPR